MSHSLSCWCHVTEADVSPLTRDEARADGYPAQDKADMIVPKGKTKGDAERAPYDPKVPKTDFLWQGPGSHMTLSTTLKVVFCGSHSISPKLEVS